MLSGLSGDSGGRNGRKIFIPFEYILIFIPLSMRKTSPYCPCDLAGQYGQEILSRRNIERCVLFFKIKNTLRASLY
jgi:hypothetical protein